VIAPIRLRDIDGGLYGPFHPSEGLTLTIGRAEGCQIRLSDPSVSRQHAVIGCDGKRWWVEDLGSRHGVSLNGSLIAARTPVQIRPGDSMLLAGLLLSVEHARESGISKTTIDVDSKADENASVEELAPPRRLELLLAATESLFSAANEVELLDRLVGTVLRTRAFDRAMVVRRSPDRSIEVVVCVPAGAEQLRPVSRTLVERAAHGRAVKLSADAGFDSVHSIVSSQVTRAVAAPITAGTETDLVLVADATNASSDEPVELVVAACRVASLARQALRTAQAEYDRATLREDLSGARSIQERLMPSTEGSVGAFRWRLSSQPGAMVAGDVACVIPSANGGSIIVGDVAGKGAAAGMVMASLQAHLAAQLESGRPLHEAVSATNEFLTKRKTPHATAVALDLGGGSLSCIDIGHGLIIRHSREGASVLLCEGGPPFAMFESMSYDATPIELVEGESILIVTDGFTEQQLPDGSMLGMDALIRAASARPEDDPVDVLLRVLRDAVGTGSLTDDATILRLWRS